MRHALILATPFNKMAATKMEFAVQMTCKSCEESIKTVLNVPGISNVFIDISNELVLVDTTLPSSSVQSLLESTGKLVVFRGFGGQQENEGSKGSGHHGAAVVVMRGRGQFCGLIRMVQVTLEECVIEGTIDGLVPNKEHSLCVHEYGDLSSGCQSCGDVYRSGDDLLDSSGVLGMVQSNDNGRAEFQLKSHHVKVWEVIGRSIVLHSRDTPSERLLCGIIARSAGLFQNTKKVCTCDGVTLWEEAAAQKNNQKKSPL